MHTFWQIWLDVFEEFPAQIVEAQVLNSDFAGMQFLDYRQRPWKF